MHTSEESRRLNAALQDSIRLKFPGPLIKVNKFELSPLTEAVIEARFLGPDPAVLDSLVGQAIEIMRRNPKVADARNEWGKYGIDATPRLRSGKSRRTGHHQSADDAIRQIQSATVYQ